MIIKLPLPNKELNPNRSSGNHWAATKNIRAKAKQDAYYATKEAMQNSDFKPMQALKHLTVTITYTHEDNRRRDCDNLLASSKSQIDGIAQALDIDDRLFNPLIIIRKVDKANIGMSVELY